MNRENTLPNTFMLLGVLLLIFAFIAPFISFGAHLGNTATPFASAAAFLLLISAIFSHCPVVSIDI